MLEPQSNTPPNLPEGSDTQSSMAERSAAPLRISGISSFRSSLLVLTFLLLSVQMTDFTGIGSLVPSLAVFSGWILMWPIIVALHRGATKTTKISLVTLFLGFTIVGYIAALVMATRSPIEDRGESLSKNLSTGFWITLATTLMLAATHSRQENVYGFCTLLLLGVIPVHWAAVNSVIQEYIYTQKVPNAMRGWHAFWGNLLCFQPITILMACQSTLKLTSTYYADTSGRVALLAVGGCLAALVAYFVTQAQMLRLINFSGLSATGFKATLYNHSVAMGAAILVFSFFVGFVDSSVPLWTMLVYGASVCWCYLFLLSAIKRSSLMCSTQADSAAAISQCDTDRGFDAPPLST